MKTQTEHTPGPWNVNPDKANNDFPVIAELPYYVNGENAFIAVCRAFKETDARLLAAAPALLQVLKSMNHVEDGYCICPLNDGLAAFEKHSTSCKDANLAISKAEGSK